PRHSRQIAPYGLSICCHCAVAGPAGDQLSRYPSALVSARACPQWRDDITLPPRGLFPIGKSRECFRMAAWGRVSRAPTRVLAARNCTRDEGGPFGFGNQVLISSHRKLLRSKVVVESVAETPGQDPSRHGRERRAQANRRRSVESGLGDAKTGG